MGEEISGYVCENSKFNGSHAHLLPALKRSFFGEIYDRDRAQGQMKVLA